MEDWKSILRVKGPGVTELECSSWLEFMTFIEERHRITRGLIYRGQREAKWPIESTLFRELKIKIRGDFPDWADQAVSDIAAKHFSNDGGMIMQSYASHLSRREGPTLTDVQVFITGRHQGLLTPFIDWTRSPYVAAFFGAADVVETRSQASGQQFSVDILPEWLFPFKLSTRTSDNAELKRHALKVDGGYLGNPRGIAQRAVATYLYPQTDIETFVEETLAESPGRLGLTRVLLPHSIAMDALNHLHHMNVNYLTLFPDGFGLAKQANLNFFLDGYEGMGNWSAPPGFDTLIPTDVPAVFVPSESDSD